jgi:hypothetical protein
MRNHLAKFTLGSVLAAARGEASWPDEASTTTKRARR